MDEEKIYKEVRDAYSKKVREAVYESVGDERTEKFMGFFDDMMDFFEKGDSTNIGLIGTIGNYKALQEKMEEYGIEAQKDLSYYTDLEEILNDNEYDLERTTNDIAYIIELMKETYEE